MLESSTITPPLKVARPQAGEYAQYYERYISLVQGNDILATLDDQRRQMMLLLSGRDDADGDFRYAPEKWTTSQVLGHVCDTERIFAYRALRIARGDQYGNAFFTELPGQFVPDSLIRARNQCDLAFVRLCGHLRIASAPLEGGRWPCDSRNFPRSRSSRAMGTATGARIIRG